MSRSVCTSRAVVCAQVPAGVAGKARGEKAGGEEETGMVDVAQRCMQRASGCLGADRGHQVQADAGGEVCVCVGIINR